MRKIYSFFAFALMMAVSLAANAWSYDLPSENEVLLGETYNMRLYKSYDFYAGNFNGEAMSVTGDGCFTLSADAAAFKLNNFAAYQVQAPEQMQNFYIQIGTGAVNLRSGAGKDGLHNYGSGSRYFAIADVKAGQIIVCQWGNSKDGSTNVCQPSSAITDADACTYTDITADVHTAQDANLAEGEESKADAFTYWRVETDGYFVIEMQRYTSIQGIQIWLGADAAESVSSPSLKVVGVNGDSRKLEFKTGESTFGTSVRTFYTKDGTDPVFLKDTEDVATWTYTYDSLGVKIDSVPETYKKVLDQDAVNEFGTYGDYEYNPEDGSIDVYGSDDEDGDGIVVVKAASVSESGTVSDIVTINVSINAITLNAPTLSLKGVNGTERTYSIGWTNNTLCGENYSIKVEADDASILNEYDVNSGIGESITITKNAKVTVSVEGYEDGVLEYEADAAGINMSRANTSSDEEGNTIHDWNFVNLSQEMADMFNGNVIESYYEVVGTDTITYTLAEYNEAEAAGTDVSNWVSVAAQYGWYQPISSNRTTLNVVEGGLDMNSNGYGYVVEQTGIFHDLAISCPPNTNNASCIFKYMDKADGNELGYLGVYFMAKPTITFPRSVAKAGQYVEIYYGQGGSNYTTTTTHQFYEVPTDTLLSVTLPSGGVHVFYIDVYTYDELPADALENAEDAWNEVVAINGTKAANKAATYYTVSGAKLSAPAKGINIVKYTDGTTKKVLVK